MMRYRAGVIARACVGAPIVLLIVYYTILQIPKVEKENIFFQINETSANILRIPYKDVVGIHHGDLTTARFFSPLLDSEDIVKTVRHTYATSKRVRKFYENPRLKRDKFTIVMLSYKRTDHLYTIFRLYCGMTKIIDKILIIWNNIGEPIPEAVQSIPCSFPIVFLPQKRNSLNNRFFPYAEIETECVFSLDDDHIISEESLIFGFNIWKGFPHLLVGYFPRRHGKTEGKYYYHRKSVTHGEPYSIVLTVAMFMNKKYLDIYTNNSHKEIHQFVDKYTNGEDISMVAVVANHLKEIDQPQCACLWVGERIGKMPTKKHPQSAKGLNNHGDHYEERTTCLNMLASLYGTLPIQMCSLEVTRLNTKITRPA